MCDPTTIVMVASLVAGGLSAKASYDQGQVAKAVGRNNQIMAEYAAQDAVKRGDEDAARVRRQAATLKGAQRASMAAKGLDLGVGTSAELQDQVDFFGEIDQVTARDNAKREAWSLRAGGLNARAQGDASAQQGNLAAFSTLLSTSGQVADRWSTYRKPTYGKSTYNEPKGR
jgi:hypothetical protein